MAVMIIPQAIAYGLLAGVTPQVALYASLVPMVAYVVLGTCRELSVGPAALISLMTAQAIQEVVPHAQEGTTLWVTLAILLAVMVGAVQLGLGVARLGYLVNFLSRPVVNGFMSAAALIIGASQLGLLLGVSVPNGGFFEVVYSAAQLVPDAHPLTVVLGLSAIALLLLARRLVPKLPAAFLLVAVTTALVWWFGLDGLGLAIVGEVEGGLPMPRIPQVESFQLLLDLLPYSVTIALVGFMESISVAKDLGFKRRYDVNANQELAAVGIGNLLGGLFGAYVVTGNISRTVVASQAGVKTQLAALVTASIVLLTVVAAAPVFTYLPKAALAAIIIAAVLGIIDVREPIRLIGFKRNDALALLVTFSTTLAFGVEVGILTGIGSSLALHLWATSMPHTTILGRLPGTTHYRSVDRYPAAIVQDEVVVLRIDEALYFASAPAIRDAVEHAHNIHEDVPVGFVLDCGAVNDLDATALAVLTQLADELNDAGTRLALANVSGPMIRILDQSGTLDHIGRKNVEFLSVHDAVLSFQKQIEARESERPATGETTVG